MDSNNLSTQKMYFQLMKCVICGNESVEISGHRSFNICVNITLMRKIDINSGVNQHVIVVNIHLLAGLL